LADLPELKVEGLLDDFRSIFGSIPRNRLSAIEISAKASVVSHHPICFAVHHTAWIPSGPTICGTLLRKSWGRNPPCPLWRLSLRLPLSCPATGCGFGSKEGHPHLPGSNAMKPRMRSPTRRFPSGETGMDRPPLVTGPMKRGECDRRPPDPVTAYHFTR
jgi:hypothetical protein